MSSQANCLQKELDLKDHQLRMATIIEKDLREKIGQLECDRDEVHVAWTRLKELDEQLADLHKKKVARLEGELRLQKEHIQDLDCMVDNLLDIIEQLSKEVKRGFQERT